MEEKFGKNREDDIELENEEIAEAELVDIEENSAAKLKELREKVRQADKDKMAALEDLQRAKADFLNARKRLDEERDNDRKRTQARFIEDLLPLCDSFEAALNDPAMQDAPANLQKGLRGIHSQLTSLLQNNNVTTIGVVGDTFDPALHEAIADVAVEEESEDHKVIAVVQKGYKMNEMIIRPARVTVGVFKN